MWGALEKNPFYLLSPTQGLQQFLDSKRRSLRSGVGELEECFALSPTLKTSLKVEAVGFISGVPEEFLHATALSYQIEGL